MTDYVAKGAQISACGTYRYQLWREWRSPNTPKENWRWLGTDGAGKPFGTPKSCVFVMLNPSTADGEQDDMTIRRCVSFATTFGYDRLEVINLFALRATDPKAMLARTDIDPVGWENQRYFGRVLQGADIVIAAWGVHGTHLGQDETAMGWIAEHTNANVFALQRTIDGSPKHPLYVRSDARLTPFKGRLVA